MSISISNMYSMFICMRIYYINNARPCNPIVFWLSECVNFNIHNNGRHKYERIGNILKVMGKKSSTAKKLFISFRLFFNQIDEIRSK